MTYFLQPKRKWAGRVRKKEDGESTHMGQAISRDYRREANSTQSRKR